MRRKLTEKETEMIENVCDDLGFELYKDYSGRCMYGAECFGFVTDAPGAELKFAIQLLNYIEGDSDKDIVMELLENMSECAATDSMGRATIYYYKQLQWAESGSDEEDEE